MIKSSGMELGRCVRVVQLVHARSGLGCAARLGTAAAAGAAASAARAATSAAGLAAARTASAAAAAGTATAGAARAALGAAILGDRFHREAAFERAFLALLAAAGRTARAALLVVLLLEDLLHRLGHEIDDVLEFTDLLRAGDLFLGAEDAHPPDALGLPPRRAQG